MKNIVRNFGLGKALIEVNFNELPNDVREGLIKLTANRDDKNKITEETKRILICGDVFPNKNLGEV